MEFPLFDSDNHFYEPEDCFTRHGDEAVKRYVTWVSEGKKRHLLFGNHKTNDPGNPNSVMNPTFNPVAKPGAFAPLLAALERGEQVTGPISRMLGDLEPVSPAYRDRAERLAVMDEQGVEKILLFPTLGLTVEGYMGDNPELLYQVMHSFNLWIDDDWGLNRDGRIYAPPIISMRTVEGARTELEWALGRDAAVITIQPGPAWGRSPADSYFDPFWARVNESGVLVAYHAVGGPTSYDQAFKLQWGQESADLDYLETFRRSWMGFDGPIMDVAKALILGNLFGRFPNIKMASIEMGGTWVPYLLHALDHAGPLLTRYVHAFGTVLADRPSDVFREHFWVSPFPEEDIAGLVEVLGDDHVLMGSDWPHAEGTAAPGEYARCLAGLDDAAIRRIMRDNALALVG